MLFLKCTPRSVRPGPDAPDPRRWRSCPAPPAPLEGGDHGHKVTGRTAADVAAELADATVHWLDAQVGRPK
jgi:hypothetical protein